MCFHLLFSPPTFVRGSEFIASFFFFPLDESSFAGWCKFVSLDFVHFVHSLLDCILIHVCVPVLYAHELIHFGRLSVSCNACNWIRAIFDTWLIMNRLLIRRRHWIQSKERNFLKFSRFLRIRFGWKSNHFLFPTERVTERKLKCDCAQRAYKYRPNCFQMHYPLLLASFGVSKKKYPKCYTVDPMVIYIKIIHRVSKNKLSLKNAARHRKNKKTESELKLEKQQTRKML